jgi:hypothetical protein
MDIAEGKALCYFDTKCIHFFSLFQKGYEKSANILYIKLMPILLIEQICPSGREGVNLTIYL